MAKSTYGRCPRCGHRSTPRGQCSNCDYTFALSRYKKPYLTDKGMGAYVNRASKQGTRHFCADDVYRLYYGTWKKKRRVAQILALVILVGYFIFMFTSGMTVQFTLLGSCVMVLFVALNQRRFLFRPPSQEKFKEALAAYQAQEPSSLFVDRPRLEERTPRSTPADVYNYGVERILFVDDPIMVDLLVLNGWHAEHRTLVLSQTGYPRYLKGQGVSLLTENANLPVFLLHGSGTDVDAMKAQIREVGLPIDPHPVTDLGMSVEDFKKHPKLKKGLMGRSPKMMPITMLGYGLLSSAIIISMTEGLLIADLLDVDGEYHERLRSLSFG